MTWTYGTVYWPPAYVHLPEKVIDLDEGMFAVTALTESGQIYNWGYNHNHALGREHTKWYYSPTRLDLPEKIVRIHAGESNTAALSESGTWYMWGDNTCGGLMTGDMEPVSGPVKILTPEPFIDIAPGYAHCLALTADGEVYLWGSYQVSIGDLNTLEWKVTQDDLKYKKVPFPEAISKIEVGDKECFALSVTGKLYSWGYDELGVLGLGEDDGIVQPLIIGNFTDEPTVVLEQVKDFSFSPEAYSVLAVTQSGDVYVWGQVGFGDDRSILYCDYPKKVVLPEKITRVYCDDLVFFALGESGTLYAWGWNYFRKDGEYLQEPVPIVLDSNM